MKAKKKSPLWELQNRAEKQGKCAMCSNLKELTVDHIFPASLLIAWGIPEYTDDSENLQLICPACQILKKARFDFHNPKTIPLIEKYIGKIKEKYG